jgi:flavodoxin
MKVLVVYYSNKGKTELAAKTIASALNSEIRKIQEIGKRQGITGFIKSGFQAILGYASELKPMDFNVSGYDLIVIGSPVWASSPAPAVNSFVKEAGLKGKKVVLFFTLGGTGSQGAIDKLKQKVESMGGKVMKSFAISVGGKSQQQIIETSKKIAGGVI